MRGENYVGIIINMVFNDVHRFVDVTQPEGFFGAFHYYDNAASLFEIANLPRYF